MLGGAGLAWMAILLVGRRCTGQLVYRTKNSWEQTLYFNCTMADSNFYAVTTKTSRHECRMLCSVDPTCMSVSAVPLVAGGFECRTSTEPRIDKTNLTQGWDAVTFYKSESQYSFAPSVGGVFYWAEVKAEPRSAAKLSCAAKGGRLAILHSEAEFQAAIDATQHFGDTDERFMVDLERSSQDKPFVWGDGVVNPQQAESETFDYHDRHDQLGMSIMIQTSLTAPLSLRKYNEAFMETPYPFVCQYNPCGVPW